MTVSFGLDVGSNSVGSAWIDHKTGQITVGLSIFPAGVNEAEDKRGDPKNVERRNKRRARITLARRSHRKRLLRLKLISVGLLPPGEDEFNTLLQETDPWELRRQGLTGPLALFQFGRVLLHLAQRRGALGFDAVVGDKGKVKEAITSLKKELIEHFGSEQDRQAKHQWDAIITSLEPKKNRTDQENDELEAANEELSQLCDSVLCDSTVTFGRFIANLRDERRTAITTLDKRRNKRGPREWRRAIRNQGGNFEFHADRAIIRDEFAKLWDAQKRFGGPLAEKLTDKLRLELDDASRDSRWRHKGLLFGQRKQSWDLSTLGRCVLEPSERCVPHADMHASRYLVVETINNLKIIERGMLPRSLSPGEREKIKTFLSGPLGVVRKGKQKGQPKRTVTVSDLRELMEWGAATKTSQFRFNIEADEERQINTDWFSREIIHGAITQAKWAQMPESSRKGINRAILKHDPDEGNHAEKLKKLVMQPWAGLSETQADALVAAWKKRPRPDANRLKMSRRAVRNLLAVMDRDEPWPDPKFPGQARWLTQIEARKCIAADTTFLDLTTGNLLDKAARRRYDTGIKGATARDRHYIKKHLLKKNKELVYGPDGQPLHEPPPAPLISNPVVRKAIHEVRRHVVDFMKTFGRKPDEIHVELAREAKMGKVNADRLLLRNRLRNRIRNDIINTFNLSACSSTQQRAAIERVVLAVQQQCRCPLCGKTMVDGQCGGLTLQTAALGQGCEVAHIIPKGSGGHNGLGNVVIAHTKCNRDMARRTPRQYWNATLAGGFNEGISWVETIFSDIQRPKISDATNSNALWLCYFNWLDDKYKLEQFKKDVKDIQEMTESQGAATRYAARQVMTYLADALYEGNGLPERGGDRLIFATDGMWTSRLRREWGLFFDRHGGKAKGLTSEQEHHRQEKNRGDHRHHAIDAIVIALSTEQVRRAWEAREVEADRAGINTADEEAMENYRKQHPLNPPAPFNTREQLRAAVQLAVFGDGPLERPVTHRAVKRKLIGNLHEETLFGPVVDRTGSLTEYYTAKKSVLALDPNHLRKPEEEAREDAIKRLAGQFRDQGFKAKQAIEAAARVLDDPSYEPRKIDPPPGKSGIVRDVALRMRIRDCLSSFQYEKRNKNGERVAEPHYINPDDFTENELKQAVEVGAICQASGIPIRSVVLLRTMSDPAVVSRYRPEYTSANMVPDERPASKRAYVGGNNHHIEIRVIRNEKGDEKWNGEVISAFVAAQRKLDRLRAFKAAGIPRLKTLRKLPKAEREKFKADLRRIERAHPVVNRGDDEQGGQFVMSLCEGEMLLMKHKHTGEVGYFVVAKLDKPRTIVVVPHWDARTATERKDSEGKKVPDSKREQFAVTPSDLKSCAPPGYPHAMKIRVSPQGVITFLHQD